MKHVCRESGSQGIVAKKWTSPPRPVLATARRVQASLGAPNESELGMLPITWADMRLSPDWSPSQAFEYYISAKPAPIFDRYRIIFV